MRATPASATELRPPRQLPRWLGDAVALLLVLGAAFAPEHVPNRPEATAVQGPIDLPVVAWILVAVAAAAVLTRRRFPRTIVGATVAVFIAGIVVSGPSFSYLVAVAVAVYNAAKLTDRRTTSWMALGTIVVVLSGSWLVFESDVFDPGALLLAALIAFASAAGDASRSRLAYIEAITERARKAEETRESEALRRVAEERLRIARDLHDAVGHQITVINLNAGVASQALTERPVDAERALGTIRTASRAVLTEIGELLAVLRNGDGDGPHDRARTASVAGIERLDELIADFAASGLAVQLRQEGAPVRLDAAVDEVALRIVQEAFTNAHKHGADASALLDLEYSADALGITVTNTTRTVGDAPSPTSGHGLLGVRERVASVHGSFATVRGPGPVFRFEAVLPLAAGLPTPAAGPRPSGSRADDSRAERGPR
ncbi:sensor histidine kinase [Compostimonas suwonensis]|uniref:histidine kinase n=1 Tax=Compostimonas suwonensis TaxID=1048394 RepID=A0A2M9C4F9_9MICO|nr:histidine kinase [Compostimonas suwonensis]PJJ65415.1 signal transduction histidine kinase [Compostimonas suwonensis]